MKLLEVLKAEMINDRFYDELSVKCRLEGVPGVTNLGIRKYNTGWEIYLVGIRYFLDKLDEQLDRCKNKEEATTIYRIVDKEEKEARRYINEKEFDIINELFQHPKVRLLAVIV